MCVERVEQGTQNAALRGSYVRVMEFEVYWPQSLILNPFTKLVLIPDKWGSVVLAGSRPKATQAQGLQGD